VSRRTLIILLFVSLALNLFIVGAIAGGFVFGERFHHRRPPQFRGGPPMFAAGASLPDAERGPFLDALRSATDDAKPKIDQARALRRDAWLKLGGDSVDAKGIDASLDQARALEGQARADVEHKIVDFAAHLPAAERGPLSQALAHPMPHRGGPRRGPPPQQP
jgi:uncharacterized membrane protein